MSRPIFIASHGKLLFTIICSVSYVGNNVTICLTSMTSLHCYEIVSFILQILLSHIYSLLDIVKTSFWTESLFWFEGFFCSNVRLYVSCYCLCCVLLGLICEQLHHDEIFYMRTLNIVSGVENGQRFRNMRDVSIPFIRTLPSLHPALHHNKLCTRVYIWNSMFRLYCYRMFLNVCSEPL